MTRTAIVPLFVTILLVVSGCNALDIGTTTDTLSVTPAPVPTNEPVTQVTPQQPPCLMDSPVENISAFIDNSSAPNWDNTSFTVREIRTVIYQNGSLRSHRIFTGRVAENLSRMHLITVGIGSSHNLSNTQKYVHVDMMDSRLLSPVKPVRRELWTNSTQVVSRTTSGRTAHYYAGPEPYGSGHLLGAIAPVREVIYGVMPIPDNASACVINQFTRNGTTLYRIRYTTATLSSVSSDATVLRNTTGYALIDSRGIIHELRYDYTKKTADGVIVTVTESIYITNIGSTTADRPLWYGIAVNRTQTQNQTNVASDTARDQGSRTE